MIKEQIINTAFDLFSQYGIKSVSMDDVAKAAGISKRTLYESFEDKETLLIEGIDHNSESLGQYLTGLEKEPFNALEVILLFYEEMMKNPRWFNEKFYEDLKKYPKAQQKIEMNKARMGKFRPWRTEDQQRTERLCFRYDMAGFLRVYVKCCFCDDGAG